MKSINKFLIDNGYHSNTERITILEMVKLVDEWQLSDKKDIEIKNKKLTESIESLLILVDSELSSLDAHEIEKDKGHIWNKVVRNAKELINQNKS